MSLDFVLTHFYRLVVHDVVLLSDVYWFYSKGRPEGKTVEEFAEILSDVLEIESQNFEEINTAKLSIGEKESVVLIVWDYFLDVILKHFLDDASQFPFWASKVIVTGQPHKFGMPIIHAYVNSMKNIYTTRGIRGLFEGCGPYVLASCYHNYKFLVKATHAFIVNVFSKLPQNPSAAAIDDELASPPAVQAGRKRIANGAMDTQDTHGTTADNSNGNSSGRPRSGTGAEGLKSLSRARKSSISDLSNLSGGDGSPDKAYLTSAKERVKDAVNGAVNNAIQMVHNLAPEYTRPLDVSSSTSSKNSAGNSQAVSHMGSVQNSGVWSLGGSTTPSYSAGLTFGGPPESGILTADGAPAGYLRANARKTEEGPYSSVAALRAKKSTQSPRTPPSFAVRLVEKGCVALMTHPLMSLAVAMVTDTAYFGQNSVFAFFRMTASRGIAGLYSGFRSRLVLSVLPLSPMVLLGVADMVIYRRMEGQGTMDSTGGVMSVVREIVAEGSVLNLFNYGLLTAAHAVPGFFSFVAMRSFSWLFLGSSLQRKHQISRREDIVKAHISLIDKKAPYE